MKCKDVKGYLEHANLKDLSREENSELKKHIDSCENCRENHGELIAYLEKIAPLKNLQPTIIDKDEFTNELIQHIKNQPTIKLPQANFFKIASSNTLRIASIIVILLSSTVYFIQNNRINTSIAQLETKYQKNTSNSFIQDYNNCIAQSQIEIGQTLMKDPEIQQLLQKSGNSLYPKQAARYASKICQQPIDISTLDIATKKKLLLQLIRKESKL